MSPTYGPLVNPRLEACSPSRVLVLERQAFLLAVGSHERSMRAADRLANKRTAWAAAQVATVEDRFRSLRECAPEADAGSLPSQASTSISVPTVSNL